MKNTLYISITSSLLALSSSAIAAPLAEIDGATLQGLINSPADYSAQVDAWQWTISDPAEFGVGDMMYAIYADCSNAEGYNNRAVYDLYMDFSNMVKEDGDTIGRKMIVPNAGRVLPDGVDFVRLMYTASISEAGVNQALFTENFADRQETKDLQASFSCTNARTYTGLVMRAPE